MDPKLTNEVKSGSPSPCLCLPSIEIANVSLCLAYACIHMCVQIFYMCIYTHIYVYTYIHLYGYEHIHTYKHKQV